MTLHEVVVLAFPGISPFHLAVPSTVFASRTRSAPEPRYRVTVCAQVPGQLTTNAGYDLFVGHGLEALRGAQTVVVPSWDTSLAPSVELLDAVRAAHARGARVVGLCLGSFVVAAAGLVDGREVATHWSAAAELARRTPSAAVRSDVLWCDLGDVVTSAGVAAALDCCLHVVRRDHGATYAADVARSLVLAPHRDGSQAQYIPAPVAPTDGVDPVECAIAWALARLDEPLDLDTWAASVHQSRRTFTRQFRARTGASPAQWLLRQRLVHARVLLESTDQPVEHVARASGFGSSAALRQHFAREFRTSPRRHRAAFRS
ncbi:GlxA family transcriptional regulator [Cellulomonas sp. URHD0024]|uniref:GlxA family transcriptional regulator n=1 Tax=Cellulomonas sp. URHD0024 TaxID=1302620 RepID=UPI00041ED594|nr:helix-turn-helix domain-containing protein [Cellulomonas sp. URHD0024]